MLRLYLTRHCKQPEHSKLLIPLIYPSPIYISSLIPSVPHNSVPRFHPPTHTLSLTVSNVVILLIPVNPSSLYLLLTVISSILSNLICASEFAISSQVLRCLRRYMESIMQLTRAETRITILMGPRIRMAALPRKDTLRSIMRYVMTGPKI